MSTGVILFAYKRPAHLQRVLKGLKQNPINHLYVYCDGPASENDIPLVNKTRNIIDEINWCETTVIKKEINQGLSESIISGINHVFSDGNDKIIVLEDDCVPAPDFIPYMMKCLDFYEEQDSVMSVSGYKPPIELPKDYSYPVFFTHRSSSWGWATWEQAWQNYEYEALEIDEINKNNDQLKQLLRKAGKDLLPMMKAQARGVIDSWAVWWSYAIVREGGVCVNPVQSKVKNIGVDGSGTHAGLIGTDKFTVELNSDTLHNRSFPEEPFVDDDINSRYNQFISGGRLRYVKRKVATYIHILRNLYKNISPRDGPL